MFGAVPRLNVEKIMRRFRLASLSLVGLVLSSCGAKPPVDRERLTQISVINALMLGRYEGGVSSRELLRYGDLGLGTFDHLDGEMIIFDGKVYQAKSDGQIREVDGALKTPFAVVTPFDVDGTVTCDGVKSLDELDSRMDRATGLENSFYAIRVDGRFSTLVMRSVPRQEPPYEPLAEVTKRQSVWTKHDVSGTLVGFRCPKWVTGLNVPGYHWHFLSDDRKFGGHVMDCVVESGKAQFDLCQSWLIELDNSAELKGKDLGKDLEKELERVERPRGAAQPGTPGVE